MEGTRNPVNATEAVDDAVCPFEGVNPDRNMLPGDPNGGTPSPSGTSNSGPPQPFTMPWTWRCHECHHKTNLAVTRRCLSCGHYFCSPSPKHKKRKRGNCTSDFDYCGWQRMKVWQGRFTPNQRGQQHLGGCWNDCVFPSACYHNHTAPLLAQKAVVEGRLNFHHRLYQRLPRPTRPMSAAELAAAYEAREIRRAEVEAQKIAKDEKRARMVEEIARASQRRQDSQTGNETVTEPSSGSQTDLQGKRPAPGPDSGPESSDIPAAKRLRTSAARLPRETIWQTPQGGSPLKRKYAVSGSGEGTPAKRQRRHSTPPLSPGPSAGETHIRGRRRASDPTPPSPTAMLRWETIAPILRAGMRAFVSAAREYRGLDPIAITTPPVAEEEGEERENEDVDGHDTPPAPRDFFREDTPAVSEQPRPASFLSDLRTAMLGWSGANERATPSSRFSWGVMRSTRLEPSDISTARKEKRKAPDPKSAEDDDGEAATKRRKA